MTRKRGQGLLIKPTMDEAKAIDNAKIARNGLFYDSQKWSDYLKQSMVLNATTMRTGGEVKLTDNRSSIIPKFGVTIKISQLYLKWRILKHNASVRSNQTTAPLSSGRMGSELSTRRWCISVENRQSARLLIDRARLRKLNIKYRLAAIILQPNRQ